jgi:hypothetical protein
MIKPYTISATLILILVIITCMVSGREFIQMNSPDKIYPSAGITKIGKLSDYFADIKGSTGDASVYYFESGKPGATVFVIGGTHPNEPAGFITATLLVENVIVKEGRLIVIPQASLNGFTYTDPLEGYPQYFNIKTKSGNRKFRFGSRGFNPIYQWPDPLIYLHYPSGQQLSGVETRNLNRAYPGRPDGSFTEKIAYAIVQLIKKENIDIAFDLHEAAPEIPIINAIVTHEKGRDIAATAILNLELDNLTYALEISPKNFHGLSHREWGDYTPVYPFLMETSNPIQGRLRGKTDAELILNGRDTNYYAAAKLGSLRIVYELNGEPLSLRVARHVQGFNTLINAFAEFFPDKKIKIDNLPTYVEIIKSGVGAYLH